MEIGVTKIVKDRIKTTQVEEKRDVRSSTFVWVDI